MTIAPPSPAAPSLNFEALRSQIELVLDGFLLDQAARGATPALGESAVPALRGCLRSGGKRIRPVLCVVGWHAAGGDLPAPASVLRVAASLELFHLYAVIHDDIMDASATRRGSPALHRTLIDQHRPGRTPAEAERVGQALAILFGDLCLVWADELIHTAGLAQKQLRLTLRILDVMRTRAVEGQLLDLTSTGLPSDDLDKALAICRLKTAGYTIQHPLQTGAALADADPALQEHLARIAVPLGEAFQLRDDLIGVFGDPATTGKSRLDDLNEGKHTALVALALRSGTPRQCRDLKAVLEADEVSEEDGARVRDILTACGARHDVEAMIEERYRQALEALDGSCLINPETLPILRNLAASVTHRLA
ncbi:polyprenyl synthetase family protein [Streptomyces sp. NPDC056084]|uniref:polyprenyl synthetase family protein n=1 Tax=unclassified Streptomyces TaxID=2593676 RepID=UPI0035D91455